MADVSPGIPRRVGAAGDTGQTIDLLLKDFADEVLLAYREMSLRINQMHMIKRVSGGAYSWQFPVFGKTDAVYHEGNGDDVLLDEDANNVQYLRNIPQGERLIYADNELVAPIFIPKIDEKLAHYDSRSIYAQMLARAIAVRSEENKLRVLYNATQVAAGALWTTASGYDSPGGTQIKAAGMTTDPETFVANLFDARQALNENEVPLDGRYCIMPPSTETLLFKDSSDNIAGLQWVNRDYAGSGSIREGMVPMIAGFELVCSNHMPIGVDGSTPTNDTAYGDAFNIFDDTAVSPVGNDYTTTVLGGDMTAAICFQRDAIGTVQVEDMSVESEYIMQRRGHLVLASLAEGTGILRPEATVLLSDD